MTPPLARVLFLAASLCLLLLGGGAVTAADDPNADKEKKTVEALHSAFLTQIDRFKLSSGEADIKQALAGATLKKLREANQAPDFNTIDRIVEAVIARLKNDEQAITSIADLLKAQTGFATASPESRGFAATSLATEKSPQASKPYIDRIALAVVKRLGPPGNPNPAVSPSPDDSMVATLPKPPENSGASPAEAVPSPLPPIEGGATGSPDAKPVLGTDEAKAKTSAFLKQSDEAFRTLTGVGAAEEYLNAAARKADLIKMLDSPSFLKRLGELTGQTIAKLHPDDRKTLEGQINEIVNAQAGEDPVDNSTNAAVEPESLSTTTSPTVVRYRYERPSTSSVLLEPVRVRSVGKHHLFRSRGFFSGTGLGRSYILIDP